MKIYLAGKMSGLSHAEMNGWRVDAETYFNSSTGDQCINPVRFYNIHKMDDLDATEIEAMEFDLIAVAKCDLVLVNLDFPDSIGTAIELFEAKHHLKKPVVAFGTEKNHPWIEACVNKRLDNLAGAVDYIKAFYKPLMR
jgi:nucleoside 2-deoxyribosyltransferase